MIRIILTAVAALTLTNLACADKFYFGQKGAKASQGNGTDYVEGVVLEETKDSYVLRVVGGTMQVAKSMVSRRVADALTVKQIEQRERQRAKGAEQADSARRQAQAAEASARRQAAGTAPQPQQQVIIVEIDFKDLLPGYRFKVGRFDPVIGRMNLSGLRRMVETYIRNEANKAAHRHNR